MYISSYIHERNKLDRGIHDNFQDKSLLFFSVDSKGSQIAVSLVSRTTQFALAIFASAHACVTHAIRGIDELIVSIIKLDGFGEAALFCLVHLMAAVVQPVGILIIGGLTLATLDDWRDDVEDFFREIEESLYDDEPFLDSVQDNLAIFSVTAPPRTGRFSFIQGTLHSPIRGILGGINEVVRTVFLGAHWCLTLPANDCDLTESVEEKLSSSVEQIVCAPLFGFVGIFNSRVRDELNMFPG